MSDDGDKQPRGHALTAALLGGAVGAAALGAAGVWSARAIARRNGAARGCDGMNAVMKTAATACELSHGAAACDTEALQSKKKG